ncbi:unnamed protein product [Heterobilharzia americana]|nr:unnamed protein product [Heterobilharzia americana]CAH8550687.1 unnamed protein product [Heterobilharzia americana]
MLCVYLIIHFAAIYESEVSETVNLTNQVHKLSNSLEKHLKLQTRLHSVLDKTHAAPEVVIIPILVIACNRPTVKRPIDKLLQLKSEMQRQNAFIFPIFVSHACHNQGTEIALNSYQNMITVIKPNVPLTNPTTLPGRRVLEGYRHVSHHYKWALDQIFLVHNYSVAIIVEDDLDLAPDFLSYFAGTFSLLTQDETLFCVSAFNDNGRPQLIDVTHPELLYRTDFFPGLGWMLLKKFWLEIRGGWPDIYWDEYLRNSNVRKGRACIRPEISRSVTFGRIGISQGQYFDSHLKHIKLNDVKVDFQQLNLSYLKEATYREQFKRLVYQNSIEMNITSYSSSRVHISKIYKPIRITYRNRAEFEEIAKHFNLMSDFKSGVSRNAYMGVVPIYVENHQLYISPPTVWPGYNESWV